MVDTTRRVKESAYLAIAKAEQLVGKMPAVGNHDNADQSVTFKGYAAISEGGHCEQWSYHPPKLETDFVEIAIKYCGICGSDIHTITSGWGEVTYPQIVGHEIVGTITAVGPDVKELKKGDVVGVGAQCWSCREKTCQSCSIPLENTCPKMVPTYDGRYPDNQQSQGGYAEKVRVSEHFTFKLPDKLDASECGPLLCAGTTVYAPLRRCGVKNGTKVGVIGIGGLGHLGLQFAAAMGADVTAISTSTRKKEDASKLGAKHFLVSTDENQMKEYARRFDVILCTANGQGNDYKSWLGLLAPRGKFINVGMPDGLNIPISMGAIGGVEGEFVASMIGPPHVIKEMLEFAADHNIAPWVEKMPMSSCNEGIEKVRNNNVKYRVVLCNENN